MKIVTQWISQWRNYRQNRAEVLAMNQRNLELIYPNNRRKFYHMADNKLETKNVLQPLGIGLPATYHVYEHFYDLRTLADDLQQHTSFVIKPARGSRGGGILVVDSRRDDTWQTAGGRAVDLQTIHKHIADILFGVYSLGLQDQAIVEAKLDQHDDLNAISRQGLADIRLIFLHHRPVMAMLRLATSRSKGKANLHQGAIGLGVDMQTGKTIHGIFQGKPIFHHPDNGAHLIGRMVPFWDNVVRTGYEVAGHVELKYIGIDIAVTPQGPVVLEINVRPGIEIQNANLCGIRGIVSKGGQS